VSSITSSRKLNGSTVHCTVKEAHIKEEFKVCPHSWLPGKTIVEYWRDGVFVAGIYPHQDGIRIISEYMTDVEKEPELVMARGSWLPAAVIKLGEKPVSV
jgi:hypothetical protein